MEGGSQPPSIASHERSAWSVCGGLRRPRWAARSVHHHRLDIRELADAERAKLAAVATTLDTAEWHPRVRCHHPVDEHRAGLDPPGQQLRPLQVAGPERGTQA